MNRRKSIPDPIIVPLHLGVEQSDSGRLSQTSAPAELRALRVDEFLQARSLAPKSQKAYRQDLQCFLNWTDKGWAEVTPRQVAQFKAYLMRQDLETGRRSLSDATVRLK